MCEGLKAISLHAQGLGPGVNDPTGKENMPLSLQFGTWIGIGAKAWTSKQLCSRQKELEKSNPSYWTCSR